MAERASTMVDQREFTRSTEPFRRELLAHCYRMLGSVDEAEDLVQETYLRAWRSYAGFAGRSSIRTWLQPIPDALVVSDAADPAAFVVRRESLRLALIASLQYLPPRQRAVLLLREVLTFPAAEVVAMLGTTTTAVKSMLQRARARLEEAAPSPDQVAEPTEPQVRAVLGEYIAAFENADAVALEKLLRRDATLELPPSAAWFSGGEAIATAVAGLGSPGDWRMIATAANGQPAAAAYLRGADGAYRAYGIVVLTVTARTIARLVVFGDPGLFRAFGLPPVHRERGPAGPPPPFAAPR